jgi:hypothetical protein
MVATTQQLLQDHQVRERHTDIVPSRQSASAGDTTAVPAPTTVAPVEQASGDTHRRPDHRGRARDAPASRSRSSQRSHHRQSRGHSRSSSPQEHQRCRLNADTGRDRRSQGITRATLTSDGARSQRVPSPRPFPRERDRIVQRGMTTYYVIHRAGQTRRPVSARPVPAVKGVPVTATLIVICATTITIEELR